MKVQIFKTCKPIYYNLKKWDLNHCPLLLITGLSGSGKTTFAQKLAKRHNAICISFDVLKFYSEASKQSQVVLDLFLKEYPEITKKISIQWKKTDEANSNDILFNYYCNLFFDFLIKYSLKNKKRIILEGIQMFVRLHPSKSVDFPVIIIRSSSLHSLINKLRRDYYYSRKDYRIFIHIIDDLYIYYIRQRRLLNTYIAYLYGIYKYTPDGGKRANEYN